ncbi:MAG: hypothetical protein C4540_00370 [Candidatus Omnitrophota bacterium]|jgi:nitroreductase|nr:MAG: hypothetical protein C4540_00370 [Candidatus Omnitrophota bacterium]
MKFKISKLYIAIAGAVILLVSFYVVKSQIENHVFKKVVERLTADSRVAEVIVTDVKRDLKNKKTYTTIKFLEYDTKLNPLEPKYFTFSGNVIQFQSMVIRFDDCYVKKGHPLKGKSAYLFMKAFMLTDRGAETFEITKINEIPSGYKTADMKNVFERRLWKRFWEYALNPKEASKVGIKNAQIEAPGTKFIPGKIYTIKIEHDGGLRIDAKPVTPILKNEKFKF